MSMSVSFLRCELEVRACMLSFTQHRVSTYHVPGIVLDAEDTAMNRQMPWCRRSLLACIEFFVFLALGLVPHP